MMLTRDSGTASVVARDRGQDLILELSRKKKKSIGCNSSRTRTAYGNDTEVNNCTNTGRNLPIQ